MSDCPKRLSRSPVTYVMGIATPVTLSVTHVFRLETHVTATVCAVRIARNACQEHREFGLTVRLRGSLVIDPFSVRRAEKRNAFGRLLHQDTGGHVADPFSIAHDSDGLSFL